MKNEEPLKMCARCGRELPLSLFGNSNITPDRKRKTCNDCNIAQQEREKAKKRERFWELMDPILCVEPTEKVKKRKERTYNNN